MVHVMPQKSAPTIGLTSVAAAATMPMTTAIVITPANIVQTHQIIATPRMTTTFANKTTFARKAVMMGTNGTQTTSVSVRPSYTGIAMVFVALSSLRTTRTVSVLPSVPVVSLLTQVSISMPLTTKSTRAYVELRTKVTSTSTTTRDFAAHKTLTTQMAFAVREEVRKTREDIVTLEVIAVHLASAGTAIRLGATAIAMLSVKTRSKCTTPQLEFANAKQGKS